VNAGEGLRGERTRGGNVLQTTLFLSSGCLQVEFWRNVVVIDWHAEVDLESMRTLGHGYQTLSKAHPKGIVGLCMVRAGVPISSPEARAESVSFIKGLGDSLLSLVSVIEDEGMYAEFMRTILRGVNVMSRAAKIISVPTLEEGMQRALPFVKRTSPRDDVSGELRGVVAAVRARVQPSVGLKAAR
jgi:hypothetical protein